MKRTFIALLALCLFLTGCGKHESSNDDLRKQIKKLREEIAVLKNPSQPPSDGNQTFDLADKSGGLGVWLDFPSGIPTFRSPRKDLPVAKAGIRAGDQLLKVDGTPTKGYATTLGHVANLTRGPVGKPLLLTIKEKKTGKIREVKVVRINLSQISSPETLAIKGVSLGMDLKKATEMLNKANPNLKLLIKKNKTGDRDEVNNSGVWLTIDKNGGVNRIDFSRGACDKIFNTDGYSHEEFARDFAGSYGIPLMPFHHKVEDVVGKIGTSSGLIPRLGIITSATDSGWEYRNSIVGWKVAITYKRDARMNQGLAEITVPDSYLVLVTTPKSKFN